VFCKTRAQGLMLFLMIRSERAVRTGTLRRGSSMDQCAAKFAARCGSSSAVRMKESTRLFFKRKMRRCTPPCFARATGRHLNADQSLREKWPACSDLSPIENFWAWLDRKAKKKLAKKATELQAEVNRFLETKEFKEHIQTLLASFRLRLVDEAHLPKRRDVAGKQRKCALEVRIQLPRGSGYVRLRGARRDWGRNMMITKKR
jgi:hypothetical protein